MTGLATGLTIKRPEGAPKEDEGFKTTRPSLPESPDAVRLQHVTPPVIDHTPAKPVFEQAIAKAQGQGNSRLAELLAKAEEQAKAEAKAIEKVRRTTTNGPVRAPKVKDLALATTTEPTILFTGADKCDDETFIKRAMGNDIHQVDMKRLFFANGGQAYLDTGLLYAQAFDNLRRAKQNTIRAKQFAQRGVTPKPVPQQDFKTFVPGLPTTEDRYRRAFAIEDAKRRVENENWLHS